MDSLGSNLMDDNHNNNVVIAFDVDGTLVSEVDSSPLYETINLLKIFQKLGCQVIVWSGGGTSYAQQWVDKLGLNAPVLPKGSISPDIVFDDMETAMGKVAIRV